MAKYPALFKAHNPDYEYRFYDDAGCRAFLVEHFGGDVVTAYDAIIPGPFKADLFRACALYHSGGYWLDMDMRSLSPIDSVVPADTELVAPNESAWGCAHGLFNAVMGCTPKHPVMRRVIGMILRRARTLDMTPVPPAGPHGTDFFGPGVVGRALNLELGRPETASWLDQAGQAAPGVFILGFSADDELVRNGEALLCRNKNRDPELLRDFREEATNRDAVAWWSITGFGENTIARCVRPWGRSDGPSIWSLRARMSASRARKVSPGVARRWGVVPNHT